MHDTKMAVVSIQFTQEQARTLTGVTLGDLRHWRLVVPYLAEKSGKAARFSFTDLLALAALAQFTGRFGTQVRMFGAGMDSLFQQLAALRPAQLEGLVIVVSPDSASLSTELSASSFMGPSLVLPVDPVISQIQSRMLPFGSAVPQQAALPFPPQAVKTGT